MKTLNVKRDRSTLASLCATNPTDPRCPQAREQFIADGGGGGGGGSRPAQIGRSSIRPPVKGSGGEGVPNVIVPPSVGSASKKDVPRSGELPPSGRDVGANERSLRAREQLLKARSEGVNDEDLMRQALPPTTIEAPVNGDDELVRQALRPTTIEAPVNAISASTTRSLSASTTRSLRPRGYSETVEDLHGFSIKDTRAYNPIAGRYDIGEFQRRLGEIDPTFRESYLRAGDGNFLDEEQGFGGEPQPTLPTEAEGVNALQGANTLQDANTLQGGETAVGQAPTAEAGAEVGAEAGIGEITDLALL